MSHQTATFSQILHLTEALFKFITVIVASLFTNQILYLSIHLFNPIKDLVVLK